MLFSAARNDLLHYRKISLGKMAQAMTDVSQAVCTVGCETGSMHIRSIMLYGMKC